MALMSFLGFKAAPQISAVGVPHQNTFRYQVHYILVKHNKKWMWINTYKQRRILSRQAWIWGDTVQTLECINGMYKKRKKPGRCLPSSHLPWRQEVFKEDVGTSLKPSWTNCMRLRSIHDRTVAGQAFLFRLSFFSHSQQPCCARRTPCLDAFGVGGGWVVRGREWNEVRLTKQSKKHWQRKKEK